MAPHRNIHNPSPTAKPTKECTTCLQKQPIHDLPQNHRQTVSIPVPYRPMTRNIYRTSHKRHDWPYSHIDRADIADRHLEKSTCRQANRRSSHENIFSRKPSLGVRQTIRYPNLHSTILANSNPYRDKIPNYSWSHRIVRLQHPMSHGISEKDYTHTTSN